MNVSKWGPGTWVFLHTVVSNYPLDPNQEDKERIKSFLKIFKLIYLVNIVEIHLRSMQNIYQLNHFMILERVNLLAL